MVFVATACGLSRISVVVVRCFDEFFYDMHTLAHAHAGKCAGTPKASCDTNIIRRMLNIYGLNDKNGIYILYTIAIEFHLAEHKFT